MDALAIFSGAAGRHLVEFTVSDPVLSLEGTASALKRDWNWAGGGRGVATHLQEQRDDNVMEVISQPCSSLFLVRCY